MKAGATFFFLLLAAASSGGCVSRYWTAPAVEGMVVDARTGAALGGVEIRRATRGVPETAVGRSAPDGTYRVDAARETVVRLPIGDPIRTGSYTFKARGYREARRPFSLFAGDVVQEKAPCRKGDTVRLEPQEPGAPAGTGEPPPPPGTATP